MSSSDPKAPATSASPSPLTSAGSIPQSPPPKADKPRVAASVEPMAEGEDLLMVDPDSLDPDMYYRFVQMRPNRLAQLRARGYRPVSRSEDGVRLIYDMEQGGAEDTVQVGDTILMCLPKSIATERRSRRDRLRDARLSAPEGQFRKKATRADVPVVTDRDMKP